MGWRSNSNIYETIHVGAFSLKTNQRKNQKTDTEKAHDKIYSKSQQTRNRRTFPQLDKEHLWKPTASIFNDERLFSP